MVKKLTITVSEDVYEGLYSKVGAGRISRFIDNLARPHVVDTDLSEGYRQMAQDETREADAQSWTEHLIEGWA